MPKPDPNVQLNRLNKLAARDLRQFSIEILDWQDSGSQMKSGITHLERAAAKLTAFPAASRLTLVQRAVERAALEHAVHSLSED